MTGTGCVVGGGTFRFVATVRNAAAQASLLWALWHDASQRRVFVQGGRVVSAGRAFHTAGCIIAAAACTVCCKARLDLPPCVSFACSAFNLVLRFYFLVGLVQPVLYIE